MSIRLVLNKDIDRLKWDECIENDESSLLYGNSWYLDIVCPDWNALIEGDYNAVFPLPIKRKFGISYVFQPLFTQQLGLFIKNEKGYSTQDFLDSIPSKYIKTNLFLKASRSDFSGIHFTKRLNHILSISDSEVIQKGFNQNTKRNIKRGNAENIVIGNEISIIDFVAFKQKTTKAQLSDVEWDRMLELIQMLLHRKLGSFITASSNDELVSAIFYTKWNARITYLFSSSSAKGKDLRASFLLVNKILLDNTGAGLVMDFEGSMDENIARYFKGFGAVEELYYEYRKGISY